MILHITQQSLWDAAQVEGTYSWSTRGSRLDEVGFIHASQPHQVAAVAEFVYHDQPQDLLVLVLDETALAEAEISVQFEDGGSGELYPHLYAPLPVKLVRSAEPAGFDSSGKFWWGNRP